MNEELPYEDELVKRLRDLALPDENIAWEDMKRRLEEEDRPVASILLKGCGGYVLLLLLLFIGSLFIVDPAKWFHNKSNDSKKSTDSVENKERIKLNSVRSNIARHTDDSLPMPQNFALPENKAAKRKVDDMNRINEKRLEKVRPYISDSVTRGKTIDTGKQYVDKINSVTKGNRDSLISGGQEIRIGQIRQMTKTDSVETDPDNAKENKYQPPHETGGDSASMSKTDSMKKKTDSQAVHAKNKSDSSAKKRYYFATDFGLHQLLPVAGQKSNPYNSLGRKNSLSDYIPSIYVRLYKDKKWFLQSEFRYGAPQYTRDILFSKKKTDSVGSNLTFENQRVKKTFYHQLPVSFDYFILPGLSAGAGVTFNTFSSVLVQWELHRFNLVTQADSVVGSGLSRQKRADSNFVTSYFQALIEAQYQWKRFSAGARYSFGLQPWLKFRLPGGEQRRERSISLQVFIRYEFWQKGKR